MITLSINKSIVLLMLFFCCLLIPHISDAGCSEDYTTDEIFAALEATPWETKTHSHGNYGEHTHEKWHREIELPAGCLHSQSQWDPHPAVEPEPEGPPVIEGYTRADTLVCIGGPCLEDDEPDQVISPTDIDGNVPPAPEPGDPLIYYPTIEIDGVIYWDTTREPHIISEDAENTDSVPQGYRAVAADTDILPEVDSSAGVVGDTQARVPVVVSDAASQEGQDSQGMQQRLDIQDGASETFAALDGKFYQVTSNPVTPVQVTEYMVRRWGDGQKALPQWIEIYNPNPLAVSLVGYEFSYVFKKQIRSIQLQNFLIPPGGAVILATHIPLQRHRWEGISESQVYNLDIGNVLKQGWSLKDPLGTLISQTGKTFGEKENPILPERVGRSRVSFNVYASEPAREAYFFGFRRDVSTPGYYEPQIPRSPALLRQRLKTTWAALKRNDR